MILSACKRPVPFSFRHSQHLRVCRTITSTTRSHPSTIRGVPESSPSNPLPSSSNASSDSDENVSMYTGTSKPRPYHLKHPPPRELPRLEVRLHSLTVLCSLNHLTSFQSRFLPLKAILLGALGISLWGAFLLHTTNAEKASSSVVKGILRELRDTEVLRGVLGDAIRVQGEWWLNGSPWIRGKVSTMQGSVDVSFKVKGTRGRCLVFFSVYWLLTIASSRFDILPLSLE